jgi:hypothetical protein
MAKQMFQEKEWHLEKKVTITIIVMLLANVVSSIWWASKLDHMVNSHESRISSTEEQIKIMAERNGMTLERLARIEANQQFQNETLREIKDAIKK